jgi:hypothetical protein
MLTVEGKSSVRETGRRISSINRKIGCHKAALRPERGKLCVPATAPASLCADFNTYPAELKGKLSWEELSENEQSGSPDG